MSLKHDIVGTFTVTAGLMMILMVAYGAWKLERWWHWSGDYDARVHTIVQDESKVLRGEIQELRTRIEKLEKK